MKENILIFGKNIGPEDVTEAKEFIKGEKARGMQKIEGEYEKTEEEIKFIAAANKYISKELQTLGIREMPKITPEEFHFLPKEAFLRKYPQGENSDGAYDVFDRVVYIAKDRMKNRLYEFQTVLHEAVHLVAYKKMHLEEKGGLSEYRTGYSSNNLKHLGGKKESSHEHFRGLDEAIVDQFIIDLVNNNLEDMKEEFNISEAELESDLVYYHFKFIEILDNIIEKIAAKKGETEKKVREDFKRGEFTGKILHLKDVEKTFGPGALRVLGALNSKRTAQRMFQSTEIKRISDFFKAESQEERDLLAAKILNDRELAGYKKNRHDF